MEYVDIVDENDNVINTTTKTEAHVKGLLHRTVICEVVNSKGQYLFLVQASHKQDPEQYVSPMGGHVDRGESEDEALKREMLEETGFKDFEYKLKGKKVYKRDVNGHIENHFFIVYEVTLDQNPQINDESVDFKWFTKDELKERLKNKNKDFAPPLRFIFESFYPELQI